MCQISVSVCALPIDEGRGIGFVLFCQKLNCHFTSFLAFFMLPVQNIKIPEILNAKSVLLESRATVPKK